MDLRIELKNENGNEYTYTYHHFVVDGPESNYTLHIGQLHFMVRTVWHTAMGELSVALTVTMIPGVEVTVPLYIVAVEALGVAGGLESAPIVC